MAQIQSLDVSDNNVQLIVSAIPETAVKSDLAALEVVIDDLEERDLLPDRLLADTAYGSEATNNILKRVTGLDRLRVRGRPAVFSSILLKVAGWNLLRAASVRSLIAKLTKGGQAGQSALFFATSYRHLTTFSTLLVA